MTTSNPVADRDLGTLRAAVTGHVLAPGDHGYDEARRAWNLATDERPAVVVMAGRPPTWCTRLWALVINHARCSESGLDPAQWFPVSADPGRASQKAAAAIAVCTTCPVRGHCLTLSLRRWDIGQHGVWGGLAAADRARLRRRAHPHAARRRNGRWPRLVLRDERA